MRCSSGWGHRLMVRMRRDSLPGRTTEWNSAGRSGHSYNMVCRVASELLSATLDQEASLEEGRRANTHLGSCAACRSWWAEIGIVNRHLRARPAETAPVLSTKVLARVSPPRPGRDDWIRYALGAVAATELALALPGVLLWQGWASIHGGRHIRPDPPRPRLTLPRRRVSP